MGESSCFLSRAEELKRYIQGLDLDQARKLWQCNEKIALLNYGRFKEMDLERRLTPALLSYEGIQYQYMAPGVFEQGQWDYVQEHLRILSGFYGILKPLDGIVPYRLEMQAKVELPSGIKSLYDYWGSSICRELAADETLIVNLASKEYSRAVEPYLEAHIDYVTCVFGTLAEDGTGGLKVKVKATEPRWPEERWSGSWRSGVSGTRRGLRGLTVWGIATARRNPGIRNTYLPRLGNNKTGTCMPVRRTGPFSRPEFQARIAARSFSGVEMGWISNCFVRYSSMAGERKAGRVGPR